jgi:hypothetical protein
MRLNTPIDKVTNEQLLKIAEKTLMWCHYKFGVNPKKRTAVKLSLYTVGSPYYGAYLHRKNTIIIFKEKHKTIEEFVRTIIHEYTHYLQPIRKYYHLVEKITGYGDNPFEAEAYRNEELFYKNCWLQVKRSL